MDSLVYVKFVLSLVLVLGLILAGFWAIRRLGIAGAAMRASGRRRLGVLEVLPVDARHRLVLVRRDDREHLLLLGASSDLVVERDIVVPRFQPDLSDPATRQPPEGG